METQPINVGYEGSLRSVLEKLKLASDQACVYLVVDPNSIDQQKWREINLAKPTPNLAAEFSVVTSSNNLPISEDEINVWVKALAEVCGRSGVTNMMARLMMRPHFDSQGTVARRDFELEFGAYVESPTPERSQLASNLIREMTVEAYNIVSKKKADLKDKVAEIKISDGVGQVQEPTILRAIPLGERVARAINALVLGQGVIQWGGQDTIDARIDAAVDALKTTAEQVKPVTDDTAGGKVKWKE